MDGRLARANLYALVGGVVAALVIGLPTVLIPNPVFGRSVPTRPIDYVFWIITIVLIAAIAASYAYPSACSTQEGKVTAGSVLSFLAVGCPVCNKLALIALGASGAVTYFQPIQPFLGLIGIALLGYTMLVRWRAVRLVSTAAGFPGQSAAPTSAAV